MIGVLDLGCGNLRSLENAVAAIGLPSRRVRAPRELPGCTRLVLPGVGHFGPAAARLETTGLGPALVAAARGGTPLLGICLGLQLLTEGSEEAEGVPGLGLLPGRCVRLRPGPGLKVPHTGWSRVDLAPSGRTAAAYFVHSYCLPTPPPGPLELLATAWHGAPFVAALRRGAVAGCQFHPERSGRWGLELLEEVLTWS